MQEDRDLNGTLKPEDYKEPVCPFCTDMFTGDKGYSIPLDRVISKLDSYLNKNDYESAESHLLFWLKDAADGGDRRGELSVSNELMGLYRKLGRKGEALKYAENAIGLINRLQMADSITAGTTFVNCATVYKAFGMADRAVVLYESARKLYEKLLKNDDSRLGGLYNNYALALADLKRYGDAEANYRKALDVMSRSEGGQPEMAITYLNIADLLSAAQGDLEADEKINECLDKAEKLLESEADVNSGYYAYVCEKCAPVFGYYGRFFYAGQLEERAKKIYEGN